MLLLVAGFIVGRSKCALIIFFHSIIVVLLALLLLLFLYPLFISKLYHFLLLKKIYLSLIFHLNILNLQSIFAFEYILSLSHSWQFSQPLCYLHSLKTPIFKHYIYENFQVTLLISFLFVCS